MKNLIRQTKLVETALDPKEQGEEGTSDDKSSGDWRISCDDRKREDE